MAAAARTQKAARRRQSRRTDVVAEVFGADAVPGRRSDVAERARAH
eukprot:gene39508-53483_t